VIDLVIHFRWRAGFRNKVAGLGRSAVAAVVNLGADRVYHRAFAEAPAFDSWPGWREVSAAVGKVDGSDA
jgi:hypothetical protein